MVEEKPEEQMEHTPEDLSDESQKKKSDKIQEKMADHPSGESPKTEDEFSFLQETIKRDGFTKEKLLRKCVQIALIGLVFGGCASIGFYALKPVASRLFEAKTDKVSIPEDQEEDGMDGSVDVAVEDAADGTNDSAGDSQSAGQEGSGNTSADVLTGENYEELMDSVYAIAEDAEKSVVSISTEDAEISGLIVANNGREYLILTGNGSWEQGASCEVTLADKSTCRGIWKTQDKVIGLAILAVNRSEVSSASRKQIKVATLANSNRIGQGSAAIALGNMFGYSNGVGFGMISTADHKKEVADGAYQILGTDIAATQAGTGVLFNLQGEVTGIILPNLLTDEENAPASAYGISDLKHLIERMSNGESEGYLGIHGVTVDEGIAESEDMPMGLYVQQVDAESPAMQAGIQSGDVLTKIGKITLTGLNGYQRALQKYKQGDQVKLTGLRRGTDGYVEIEYNVTVGSRE